MLVNQYPSDKMEMIGYELASVLMEGWGDPSEEGQHADLP